MGGRGVSLCFCVFGEGFMRGTRGLGGYRGEIRSLGGIWGIRVNDREGGTYQHRGFQQRRHGLTSQLKCRL